ncbi:MAG: hypothetical protein PHR22_05415 [Candidatus Omnitrophica bacterium]|nr:hypothetical protein [Candidatus Omnitrophota bacterium]
MTKIIVMLLAAILGLGAAAPCYCQQGREDLREVKVVDGTIFDLDWAGSKMTVKWLNGYDNSYRELALNVPDNAVIRKGGKEIDFSELQINDTVTVRYYEDPDGTGTLLILEDTASSP